MAIGHLDFDDGLAGGRDVRRVLSGLETGYDGLLDLIATMAQQVDGDGSAIAHFTYFVQQYGAGGWKDSVAVTDAHRTVAKGMWDELNSLKGKLDTDASVSSVRAALLQAFAKMR